MLLLITAPRGWGAVRTARRHYASTRAWLQHSRASTALADMLIRPYSAAELRVHACGPFILHHYEQMARAAEQEQARLTGARAAPTCSPRRWPAPPPSAPSPSWARF
jgi:ATP-binding cassette subfamily B protein